MSFVDFSSWPRDQEQTFVVYEQHASESRKKALSIGAVAGAIFFVFMVGIYAGVKPEHKDYSKDMNMDNLTKKTKKVEAPAPKAEAKPAEAPAAAPAAPAAPAEEKKE